MQGSVLYQQVTEVILQVASPFLVYQRKLAILETQHSSIAQQLIAKDIRQVVGQATNTSVTFLQDATERLKGLAPFVFPMAEGEKAWFRFRLYSLG